MQKVRSNSNPAGFQSLRDVTVLWHGWLKKLGRFSKRWRRRYFVFVAVAAGGRKELRHYDACRDVTTLLLSTPKGAINLADAVGICCFLPPPPPPAGGGKKGRSDGTDAGLDASDQRFAVITPLNLSLLAFSNGAEWGAASESQQGLSLLAALSAFYPAIDVLHSGWMTKKRERTGHSPKSIISYWKRHFFVFLASGDLLYFRDDSLNELQGRVDVRHAPTVRVTGERVIEERRKESSSLFKFASKLSALERRACLVWIATPPSKMFVLKLQEDSEIASAGSKHHELSADAKKWLALLMKGHAETKYTQLEKCAASGKYENTPEIISAIRAGIPDELRGQLWKGFSGAIELQKRAEMQRSVPRPSKTMSFRARDARESEAESSSLFDRFAAPMNPEDDSPENRMLYARLSALALRDTQHGSIRETELAVPNRLKRAESDSSVQYGRQSEHTDSEPFLTPRASGVDEDTEDDEAAATASGTRNTLKQLVKGRLGDYVYPSDTPSAEWELSARRRVLIATSRYNPFSHPCPWRVSCLLLAYLEEESAFWVINSVIDAVLPGYFHGHRPALQIDVSAFQALLESRAPALASHLKSLAFPVDRLVESWFLSIFTSSSIPLPTVLRIWDAFFSQGLRILFGVGVALFLLAEERLFHAKSSAEAEECLRATESSCIDANSLFSLVFKDDLNILWLTGDHLEKLRTTHRQRVLDTVAQSIDLFNEKLSALTQVEDTCARSLQVAERLLSTRVSGGAKRKVAVEAVDEDPDEEFVEGSFRLLQMQLTGLVDGANDLAAELTLRQSKWLALSSQLKACPLGKLPSADLHSWLSQVREGKISGAGHDASYSTTSDRLAYVPATQLIASSDMFLEPSRVSGAGEQRPSCLATAREDLTATHHYLSEVFMYSLASAVKALCATRLECLSASYRFTWHGSRWIESLVEFPPHEKPDERAAAQTARRLQRSNTNATFAPISNHRKPRTRDDSELSRHTIVEDARSHRKHLGSTVKTKSYSGGDFLPLGKVSEEEGGAGEKKAPLSPTVGGSASTRAVQASATVVLNAVGDGVDSFAGHFGAPNNQRAVAELAFQYREGSEIFHLAHGKFMACFRKYVRLENRASSWPLRERALVLEEDLEQEMNELEHEIDGSGWIDRF